MTTPQMPTRDAMKKWLDECAKYFEKRNTDGEDMAYWSNVYNAQNARAIRTELTRMDAQEAEIARLMEALNNFKKRFEIDFVDDVTGEIYEQDVQWMPLITIYLNVRKALATNEGE